MQNRKASPHTAKAECHARQVVNRYFARGWLQAASITQGRILMAAGVPVETALGGLLGDEVKTDVRSDDGTLLAQWSPPVWKPYPVPFAPAQAIEVSDALANAPIDKKFRSRVISALWQSEHGMAALRSALALGGKRSVRGKAVLSSLMAYALAPPPRAP